MNWNKIKNDYPAAWEAFVGTYHYGNIDERGDLYYFIEGMYEREYYNTRDLYDFFDEKGIYITVSFGGTYNAESEKHDRQPSYWFFNVPTYEGFNSPFATRTEAEAAAFERAFSILNNQLLGE